MILKAGTIVKHGTTSLHLESILKSGLKGDSSRHFIREQIEENPIATNSIYVGDLIAYFGAFASFAAKSAEVYGNAQNKIASRIINGEGAIPIVLTILLKEDCELLGDEDFIGIKKINKYRIKTLEKKAKKVWEKYSSGAIIRKEGIPPNWITHFEYPLLISKNDQVLPIPIAKKMHNDIYLLVTGYAQERKDLSIKQAWLFYEKIRPKEIENRCFTNKENFVKTKVHDFLSNRTMQDKSELFSYMKNLYHAVVDECEKRGLRFHYS